MQGGRSFWNKSPVVKILFLHSNGLSGDQLPDWSFKPFGTARSLQDLDSFKERGGEGGLRLTRTLLSQKILWAKVKQGCYMIF